MRKTAIIIPCYNEAERLAPEEFVEAIRQNSSLSFIFVNDGSKDGTGARITEICVREPERIKALELEKNMGKAEAVRRGVLKAIGESFDYIGYWDADLATPLNEVAKLQITLEERNAELVLASRVKLLGKAITRKGRRHILGRVFATYASLALNLPVYDTQCGAKLFQNSEAIKKAFSEPFITNWIFDVEFIARFIVSKKSSGAGSALHWSIVEHSLDEWKDMAGSKLTFGSLFIIAMDMIKFVYYFPLSGA